ncbi:Agenet domain-containing bromo-adjacent domain-containing, isoform 1 [Olea europaea subsp. europaea]|uniref:Agenet domain-containing bromo-adjacent domain-containing, isoform 1 n=2 Tax=Olea europaea subsp. europaea TaxID=158383 RepID=A0A8S0R5P3_OLEEU|nr:Agenet domain-containing bromo-adjacent domain-containing, isoform 1 [Olea europaea subsp. europaea]
MISSAAPASYIGWDELVVSGENVRREVLYYLRRSDGRGPDLVVVGKEKCPNRMYYYGIRDKKYLLSPLKYSSLLKLRSRREVIDWLNSIVTDVSQNRFFEQFDGYMENKGTHKLDADIIKDVQLQEPDLYTVEFMWLGSSWTCRKRRKHYLSFCRNGIKISVHDFVSVLAEEDKRLVAYLDDMYEDSRGNKMVVVRWFDKIDEVGFDLPHNYNDREIFFSLCLQDLSIECIDGLATVLSPEHYEKVLKAETTLLLVPFVCYRQSDNDDIKPFDITRLKGYWKQEILRNISSSSPFGTSDDNIKVERTLSDAVGSRSKKRLQWSKECEIYLQPAKKRAVIDASPKDDSGGFISSEGCTPVFLSWQYPTMLMRTQCLAVGSQVEVLSQDSGIRGCWFRALIIKRHKDKVKVQYRDIKDATNDAKNLEEWILASRLAMPDEFGIRICRTIVRPVPLSNEGKVSLVVNVGSIVDAWWHDGWWEGIVMKKKMENKLHVYLPGEKREMIFSLDDLRHSQEWIENEWKAIKERPEVVPILSGLRRKPHVGTFFPVNPDAAPYVNGDLANTNHSDALAIQNLVGCDSSMISSDEEPNGVARDLSNDDLLSQLKWLSYGKRRRGRDPVHKVHYGVNSNEKYSAMRTLKRFFAPSSLKVDPENCKYVNDTLFNSSVESPVTSLVMSR